MKRAVLAAFAVAASLTGVVTPEAAQATSVVTQSPCSTGTNYCVTFRGGVPLVATVRTVDVIAPATATSALLTFHGQLECEADASPVADALVILESQIVGITSANPSATGPGGLSMKTWMPYISSHGSGNSATFNLASTRLISVTGGQTVRYALKIELGNLQSYVECRAGKSSAFTVQYFD